MKVVRKVSVVQPDGNSVHYVVGSKYKVKINGNESLQVLSYIHFEEEDSRLKLFLQLDNETQEWKDIPKNQYTTIEFEIE